MVILVTRWVFPEASTNSISRPCGASRFSGSQGQEKPQGAPWKRPAAGLSDDLIVRQVQNVLRRPIAGRYPSAQINGEGADVQEIQQGGAIDRKEWFGSGFFHLLMVPSRHFPEFPAYSLDKRIPPRFVSYFTNAGLPPATHTALSFILFSATVIVSRPKVIFLI